jgi:hypothetical protein
MYKNATKCNETIGKWCKNKHGASKIIDTFETYHLPTGTIDRFSTSEHRLKKLVAGLRQFFFEASSMSDCTTYLFKGMR